MLCHEVWRLEMETNFPKKYLSSWMTGSSEVPEGKLDVESSGGNVIPLVLPRMPPADRPCLTDDFRASWRAWPKSASFRPQLAPKACIRQCYSSE